MSTDAAEAISTLSIDSKIDEHKALADEIYALLPTSTHKHHLRSYPQTIVASELVAKIMETKSCDSRAAVALVQPLVPRFLHHVTYEHDFADEDFFFRWSRDEGIPVFKCGCGKFQIEFTHPPRGSFNCHCRFCYTGVTAPVKAAEEGMVPTSMLNEEGGVCKTWFWLNEVKLPPDALDNVMYINVNGGDKIRSATKCCHTPVNSAGGPGFPLKGARPFNRNALYMEDGSKWQPSSPPPNVNTGASLTLPEAEISEPKNFAPVIRLFASFKAFAPKNNEKFFNPTMEDVDIKATVELATKC